MFERGYKRFKFFDLFCDMVLSIKVKCFPSLYIFSFSFKFVKLENFFIPDVFYLYFI